MKLISSTFITLIVIIISITIIKSVIIIGTIATIIKIVVTIVTIINIVITIVTIIKIVVTITLIRNPWLGEYDMNIALREFKDTNISHNGSGKVREHTHHTIVCDVKPKNVLKKQSRQGPVSEYLFLSCRLILILILILASICQTQSKYQQIQGDNNPVYLKPMYQPA